MTTPDERSLGRLAAPDPRDAIFPMRLAIKEAPPEERHWRYHGSGWWGDQGHEPQCVGYSWTHWLEDGPHTQRGIAPVVGPARLYREAQKVDEWEGEAYDGTSVRAGAKVLQTMGFVTSYHWAWDVTTVADAILRVGPVVVGTNWYRGMYEAPDGFVRVSGSIDGGHAYLLNGVNVRSAIFRIKNSWGRSWARNGHANITFEDFERLLREDGEACLAVEATP